MTALLRKHALFLVFVVAFVGYAYSMQKPVVLPDGTTFNAKKTEEGRIQFEFSNETAHAVTLCSMRINDKEVFWTEPRTDPNSLTCHNPMLREHERAK